MSMSIFDIVQSQELVSYWETLTQDRPPYFGETLFPNQQKLGLDLQWLKGASNLPVVLKPSSYDAKVLPRQRLGFDKLTASMPFFKESMLIDEEMRQELNRVLETGNQAYIDAVMDRIFKDETTLLEGAAARREQMRMMLLTTGAISITANGQAYSYDYGVPNSHKITVTTSWSSDTADIIGDIQTWQDTIEEETGVRPTRAVVSRKTWQYILKNKDIRNAILGNDSAAPVAESRVRQHILSMTDVDVYVYTKRYKDDNGDTQKFMPDDTFILMPSGNLGTGWFGTTPEQSDLMSQKVANVSITDTGVAITTTPLTDPVNVQTKASMIYLPDFPVADQIIIADIIA